ncbi:uncharacterized protein VTP21DRAFT_11302 [Calcarisporiella thermophila]|uniref:uncharacterized protein n=1 Tax=Calcarisporiella thermophila TaxID=911321 RepID=UPI003743077B
MRRQLLELVWLVAILVLVTMALAQEENQDNHPPAQNQPPPAQNQPPPAQNPSPVQNQLPPAHNPQQGPVNAPPPTPAPAGATTSKPLYVDPRSPPGVIIWQTPTANPSFPALYAISSNVTFVWGYTNLVFTPSFLNFEIVGPNTITYPVTKNMSAGITSVVWDTRQSGTLPPMLEGLYTVKLYDPGAKGGPNAVPSAGQLTPENRLKIAMYNKEPYFDRTDPNACPTCFGSAVLLSPFVTIFTISFCTAVTFLYFILY